MQMDEAEATKLVWILFAQLGVKIDYIQDNGVAVYSVPSMSDYTSQEGAMIAGELLMHMVDSFFKENSMKTEGRIRSEYWTEMMGQVAAQQIQKEINK